MKKNVILIYDIIGTDWWTGEGVTAKSIKDQITAGENDANVDEHEIRINSPGGSMLEGIAIFNIIAGASKPVKTYIDGIAASMAWGIAYAKGLPIVADNALSMAHNASTYSYGNAKQLRTDADVLDKFDNSIAVSINKATGMSMEDISAKLLNYEDNWLTADELVTMGLGTKGEATEVDTAAVKNMTAAQVFASYVKENGPVKNEGWINKVASAIINSMPQPAAAAPAPVQQTAKPQPTDNVKIKATMAALLAVFAVAPKQNEEVVELQPTDEQLQAVNDALAQGIEDKKALAEKATALDTANARIAELEKGAGAEATTTTASADGAGAAGVKTQESIIAGARELFNLVSN